MAASNHNEKWLSGPDAITIGDLSSGTAADRVGFYGVTKVVRAGAIAALTDAFGTADGTVADVTASFSQSILNDNFQEMSTKINAITLALRNLGLIT